MGAAGGGAVLSRAEAAGAPEERESPGRHAPSRGGGRALFLGDPLSAGIGHELLRAKKLSRHDLATAVREMWPAGAEQPSGAEVRDRVRDLAAFAGAVRVSRADVVTLTPDGKRAIKAAVAIMNR